MTVTWFRIKMCKPPFKKLNKHVAQDHYSILSGTNLVVPDKLHKMLVTVKYLIFACD